MTVEKLLNFLVANPPPPLKGDKLMCHSIPLGISMSQLTSSQGIQIPQRTRHASWGSTGSFGSGNSSPLSGSPPLHDLVSLHSSSSPRGHKLDRSLNSSLCSDRPSQNQIAHKNVNPTRYKTELCRPFEESGYCKYGEKCQFAHGHHELRSLSRHPKYKTDLCRTYHTVGFCPYGPRCHFIHNEDELRLAQINHVKQQQIMQHVARQVAAQQHILSHITVQQPASTMKQQMSVGQLILPAQLNLATRVNISDVSDLPRSSSMSLTNTTASTSMAESSPSLSPISMISDDIFGTVPSPPPGFGSLPPSPPTTAPRVFNFQDAPAPSVSPVGTPQDAPAPSVSPVGTPQCPVSSMNPLIKDKREMYRCSTPAPVDHNASPTTRSDPVQHLLRLPIFSRIVA